MLIDISKTPRTSELRWFAALWFPAMCFVVGFSTYESHHAIAAGIWTVGAVLSITGLVQPRVIAPVYWFLLRVTFPLGWVLSHAVLFIVFFGVVTPIGFLVRVFHDPLQRPLERTRASYWIERAQPSADDYFRQS
jgi:hypothetical protein